MPTSWGMPPDQGKNPIQPAHRLAPSRRRDLTALWRRIEDGVVILTALAVGTFTLSMYLAPVTVSRLVGLM